MASTTSSTTLPQGFSIYQPALGAPLQFFPAVGTPQLDEMMHTYIPGPASTQEKRATVAMDFLEYAQITGQSFKFYTVYNVAESPAGNSPASSSNVSSFNASPLMPTWDWSMAGSAAASPSSVSGGKSRNSASSTAKQLNDYSNLPGMKILTKDGVDVTNTAARGSKTKEQRDHAHLMRIIKACEACKKKKIRCDPSHKKRNASQVSPPAAIKASKKARTATGPEAAMLSGNVTPWSLQDSFASQTPAQLQGSPESLVPATPLDVAAFNFDVDFNVDASADFDFDLDFEAGLLGNMGNEFWQLNNYDPGTTVDDQWLQLVDFGGNSMLEGEGDGKNHNTLLVTDASTMLSSPLVSSDSQSSLTSLPDSPAGENAYAAYPQDLSGPSSLASSPALGPDGPEYAPCASHSTASGEALTSATASVIPPKPPAPQSTCAYCQVERIQQQRLQGSQSTVDEGNGPQSYYAAPSPLGESSQSAPLSSDQHRRTHIITATMESSSRAIRTGTGNSAGTDTGYDRAHIIQSAAADARARSPGAAIQPELPLSLDMMSNAPSGGSSHLRLQQLSVDHSAYGGLSEGLGSGAEHNDAFSSASIGYAVRALSGLFAKKSSLVSCLMVGTVALTTIAAQGA